MVPTPKGLEPAGSDVKIDMPVDIPAGETALVTLHSPVGERFVITALGHSVKLGLGP